MNIFLLITILLMDGAIYTESRPTRNYDECFSLGRDVILKIERQYDERIKEVRLECVEENGG